MTWKKQKALKTLGIEQEPFNASKNSVPVHGYAYTNKFAVNPDSPFKGAAGFHELSHIVLGHTAREDRSYRAQYLAELEACASAIICLKSVGAKKEGIEAQREHYLYHRQVWKEMEGALPEDFKPRVNRAAQLLLTAGALA